MCDTGHSGVDEPNHASSHRDHVATISESQESTRDEDNTAVKDGAKKRERRDSREEGLAKYVSPCTGIATSIFGLISFTVDIGSDLWLAIEYFTNGDDKWAAWTLSFTLLAPVLIILVAAIACLGCVFLPVCQLLFAPITA